ncbi:MAG: M28 family peptidase [Acidobacteriota bacterium]|jgi:Zn-dependent M28 family amino/carboxypeptidase
MLQPQRVAGLLTLAAGLVLAGCAAPQDEAGAGLELPADAESAAETIDEATLSGVVDEISDDAYGGRGPSTEGDEKTQQYLINYLEGLGYEPGGPDGAWRQPIAIVGIESEMPESWTFRADGETWKAAWWDDYIAASGVQQESVSIEDAEVVFVGYGIEAPEEDWDDFKGADLKGKILLMLNNDPDWDPELFAGERRLYYGRWTYKYETAARQGAAGAILIHTEPSAGYPWQVVQTSWTGEQFELPAGDEPRIRLAGWLTEEAAGNLVALGGLDLPALVESARRRDFHPVPLGVTTSIRFRNTVDVASRTANVAGLLRGSDPVLADQFVVYTAHHDHLGIGQPDEAGDAIYNGARDNASGVASILAIAKAFTRLEERPRRSILILPVAAEEQGLLGSLYFSQHPTVPPGRIAADINIDGGNIFGRTRDVAIVGRGKSDLEDLLDAAAALQGRAVVDEPDPDKGYYYRSDQFNFAKIGVPSLYFKSGRDYLDRPEGWGREMEDRWRQTRYHQPSDEVYEDWSYAGMVEDVRLAFYVGLSVAEADDLPAWRPGDEFERTRIEMLQQAAAEE